MSKFVWLVSYPRSGNTWLRLLLANIQHPEVDCGYLDIDKFTPDSHQRDWPSIEAQSYSYNPVFVKCHFDMISYYLDYPKAVYSYRDGRDVALSCYHFGLWQATVEPEMSFEQFLNDRFIPGKMPFGSWRRHVGVWLQRRIAVESLAVKYEDLLADPLAITKKIVEFGGLKTSLQIIKQAVERTKYSRLLERRASEGVDPRKLGLRGLAGGWKDEFSPAMDKKFWSWAGEIMTFMGYSKEE